MLMLLKHQRHHAELQKQKLKSKINNLINQTLINFQFLLIHCHIECKNKSFGKEYIIFNQVFKLGLPFINKAISSPDNLLFIL